MEIKGKIAHIMEARSGVSQSTGNSWMTQEYVLEYGNGQYYKKLLFEVRGQERIEGYKLKVGDEVTVSFDINAREWNGRWFNTVNAWNISRDYSKENQAATTEHKKEDLPFGPSSELLDFE